jgi:hypothetical protein
MEEMMRNADKEINEIVPACEGRVRSTFRNLEEVGNDTEQKMK